MIPRSCACQYDHHTLKKLWKTENDFSCSPNTKARRPMAFIISSRPLCSGATDCLCFYVQWETISMSSCYVLASKTGV